MKKEMLEKNANIHFILFMLANDWMLSYELLATLLIMPWEYPGNGYILIQQANIAQQGSIIQSMAERGKLK